MSLKVVTDHGWPKASDGSDANAFDAFKNERDYIAKVGMSKTTVAAMDWAARELDRLLTLERECKRLVATVRATEDHTQWFGPVAAILSLMPDGDGEQGPQETKR